MKKYYFASFGFILLTVGFVFFTRRNIPQPVSNESIIEEVTPITEVAALGKLVPAGKARVLAAPVTSFGGTPRVQDIFVKEGDIVEKDQILAVFDNRKKILADLEVAGFKFNRLKGRKEYLEIEVKRYEGLTREGASPQALLDEKNESLRSVVSHLVQLSAEIKSLEVDLAQSFLKSPIDGIIIRINSREGERPSIKGVLEVGDNENMEALIEVYESDISRISINQKVRLISENGGFPGELYGIVSRISPLVRQRNLLSTDPTGDVDARVVEVRVTLDKSSSVRVKRFIGMKVIAIFEKI